MPSKIWFHADDYAVTKGQADRILDCHRHGVLNSISVIANVNDLSSPLELLEKEDKTADKIRRILHINFVEGKPVSDISRVDMLVGENGYFDKSFVDILKWNYTLVGKKREKLKEQLKCEISAQLRKVTREYDYKITGIDSHQHYHMIPIVFDAMLEVIDSDEFKNVNIQYVRIPVDPLKIVFGSKKKARIPIINIIKWIILASTSKRNRKILKNRKISTPVFFGIFYTCEMKCEAVKPLLKSYIEYAKKRGLDLELMFHPGNLTSENELLDASSDELKAFYMSPNRLLEAQCIKGIRL